MTENLKFSGISFGGRKPNVTIYGKTHKVIFGKFRRGPHKNKYGFEVHKHSKPDYIFRRFYFLFPLFDVGIFLGYQYGDILFNFLFHLFAPLEKTIGPSLPTMSPEFLATLGICLCISVYILCYVLLYILLFRGVRKWHGTEHKLIAAAENNDINNAKQYDPIHERCGGTLVPTFFLGYIIWLVFFYYTGIFYGEMTIITILIFLNIKYFHKYDKVGIYVGKLIQKYLTIKEPDEWQLHLGQVAIRNLVNAENGENYDEVQQVS